VLDGQNITVVGDFEEMMLSCYDVVCRTSSDSASRIVRKIDLTFLHCHKTTISNLLSWSLS